MSYLKNNFAGKTPQDRLYVWITLLAAFIAIILSLSILFFFRFLPNKLPLFYSLPWGERQLATLPQLLTIPTITILITLINLIVAKQLHSSQSFLKMVLNLASFITTVILTITFIKIVFVFI